MRKRELLLLMRIHENDNRFTFLSNSEARIGVSSTPIRPPHLFTNVLGGQILLTETDRVTLVARTESELSLPN